MLDITSRASKRVSGAIRNIANQLAQIAAGWEAAFDGPVLVGEPGKGNYVMDLVQKVSRVNDRQVGLGMASILEKWLEGELVRLRRDHHWISEAMVEVQYELVPSDAFMDSNPGYWTSQAFVARLSATARVATSDGAAEANFKNAQAVTGQAADPVRPMPQGHLPAALKARSRPVQIKRTRPRNPRRDT
jgi:hypothetical protein